MCQMLQIARDRVFLHRCQGSAQDVQNYEYTYHQIACTHKTWSIGLQRLQNEFPLLGVPTRPRLLAILDEVGPMLAIPLQEPSTYGHQARTQDFLKGGSK